MAAPPKYKTYKKQVKLGAGQQLHYTPGKGYWAGPKIGPTGAPPKPIDPFAPLSPAVLGTQATTQANAALAPEKAEVERQRAIAAQRAKNDQAAMLGLASTVAEMQKGLVPGAAAPYAAAAGQIGDLAQGFSAGVAERLAAGQGANAEFAAGQGAQATPAVDPTAVKDVTYGLGGFVPGASLAAQGAAAGAWAQSVPAITAAALKGDYQRALFEAKSQDDEYAQQLIATAAKFPQLRDAALQELRTYELQKGQAALDKRQVGLQERAQDLYERQFGEVKRQNRVEDVYRMGQLQLETLKAQQAVQEAADKGRLPNATLSKVYGYVVDGNGQPILQGGKKIKVVNSTANKGKGKDGAQAKAQAFRETAASMDEFINATFKEDGFWLEEFDPSRRNSAYQRGRARLMKRFWPEVRSYSTAAGRSKLRAEFGRLVDAVLAAQGIVPRGGK